MIDRFLERGANIALIVAALFISIRIGQVWLKPSLRSSGGQVRTSPEGLPQLRGKSVARFQKGGTSGVLIYVSPTCHFCEESMQFYRKLLRGSSKPRPSILLAVAGLSPATDDLHRYVRQRGLEGASIVDWSRVYEWGVRNTPMVAYYDGSGIIQQVWFGKLSSVQQQEVTFVLSLSD